MTTELDCRTCGACCVPGVDEPYGFAAVTAADFERMSSRTKRKLVQFRPGQYSTPTVYTDEFGSICSFLRGTPGQRCSCGIYATRPDVCRRFKPGGVGCKQARIALGVVE